MKMRIILNGIVCIVLWTLVFLLWPAAHAHELANNPSLFVPEYTQNVNPNDSFGMYQNYNIDMAIVAGHGESVRLSDEEYAYMQEKCQDTRTVLGLGTFGIYYLVSKLTNECNDN